MGDAVKVSHHVPSICVQNAMPSLLSTHIIPSRQIYVPIENPSVVHPSPVLLLDAMSKMTWAQPTMCPTLKTCNETDAGAFLTCTEFEP